MKLALIPPGEFMMGSPATADRGLAEDRPQHRVKITRPFYLGLCEVTQIQYQRVMGNNPSRFLVGGPSAPVDQVAWYDALEFCRRLSALPKEKSAGRVYRLPTEAEWEYACRAGTATRWFFGDNESEFGFFGWHRQNCGQQTRPVAQKRPNAWGLYDMCGNVWEWCNDRYGSGYYANSPIDDPTGPASGSTRMLRGGSWYHPSKLCRSAVRHAFPADNRNRETGFRVAMSVDVANVPTRSVKPPMEIAGGARPTPARPTGPAPRIEKIVLWNQHNGDHNNCGTRMCNLVLYRQRREVWRQNAIVVPWQRDQDTSVALDVPRVSADRVRVEITQWHGAAGGLAEIEVFSGGKNIADGCKVHGTDRGAKVYRPALVNDGITSSEHHEVGYWVAADGYPAWAEIELAPPTAKSGGGSTRALRRRPATKVRPFDPEALQSWRSLGGHNRTIRSVAFSPDCSLLASVCDDRTVRLWNTATGQERATLRSQDGRGPRSIAFSPDNKWLAGAYSDNTVKIWNLATGRYQAVFVGHARPVRVVAFSPDGKTLASGSDDQTVILWDAKTGQASWRQMQGQGEVHVRSVAFSPCGRLLAVGSRDGILKLWEVKSGKLVEDLQGHSRDVLSVAFSPDGKTLASGGYDRTLILWDVATGKPRNTLTGKGSSAFALALHPAGEVLAVGGFCPEMVFWDMQGRRVQTVGTGSVFSMAFSADGTMLAFGGGDGNLALWDYTLNEETRSR